MMRSDGSDHRWIRNLGGTEPSDPKILFVLLHSISRDTFGVDMRQLNPNYKINRFIDFQVSGCNNNPIHRSLTELTILFRHIFHVSCTDLQLLS